jgi:ditrans,polycis-polyprenyl diphosphate synthase
MSLVAFNNTTNVQYTWLQRFACNIIRYGCTSRPQHIAIVMDGNRRFAREHNFERAHGHALGADKLFDVCRWCHDLGINELSVYAFSLENLKRSQDEIDTLMNIARLKLNELEKSLEKVHEQQICIRIIGNLELLPEDIRKSSYHLMNETNQYKNFILNVCLYYTSRNEITNVIKDLVKGFEKNFIQIDDIDDDLIIQSLIVSTSQTGHLPDIFLRTSGELRLSDFMLLQCRFSMWIFAEVYWPAFSVWHLYWIVLQYEMKSKELINVQNQCQNILKQDKNDDEEKNQRITTYLNWLEQQKTERFKIIV